MPKFKVNGKTLHPGERTQTDGRYQVHYLPTSRSIIYSMVLSRVKQMHIKTIKEMMFDTRLTS